MTTSLKAIIIGAGALAVLGLVLVLIPVRLPLSDGSHINRWVTSVSLAVHRSYRPPGSGAWESSPSRRSSALSSWGRFSGRGEAIKSRAQRAGPRRIFTANGHRILGCSGGRRCGRECHSIAGRVGEPCVQRAGRTRHVRWSRRRPHPRDNPATRPRNQPHPGCRITRRRQRSSHHTLADGAMTEW